VTFEDGLAELRRLNKTSDELSERLEATRSAQTNLYLEMNSEDRKRHWVANKGEWVYLARAEAAADADAELLVYFAEAAWPKELASGARWDNDKWSSFEDDADRQVTSAEFLKPSPVTNDSLVSIRRSRLNYKSMSGNSSAALRKSPSTSSIGRARRSDGAGVWSRRSQGGCRQSQDASKFLHLDPQFVFVYAGMNCGQFSSFHHVPSSPP
jgi:hypothetical protein